MPAPQALRAGGGCCSSSHLKTNFERRRKAMRDRVFLALFFLLNALPIVALSHGFGWI
jgi:hypothetical protein